MEVIGTAFRRLQVGSLFEVSQDPVNTHRLALPLAHGILDLLQDHALLLPGREYLGLQRVAHDPVEIKDRIHRDSRGGQTRHQEPADYCEKRLYCYCLSIENP